MHGRYVLGIDPPKGWCFLCDDDNGKRIINAGTVKGMEALEKIVCDVAAIEKEHGITLFVRIELPKKDRPWARTERLPLPVRFKVQASVGMNRERAESIGRLCKRLDLTYQFVEPSSRKPTQKQIEAITGYNKRTSEHARDAIAIAWR